MSIQLKNLTINNSNRYFKKKKDYPFCLLSSLHIDKGNNFLNVSMSTATQLYCDLSK